MMEEEDDITNAVDEVCMDWRQRVNDKLRRKREFRQRSVKLQQKQFDRNESGIGSGKRSMSELYPYKFGGEELATFDPEQFQQDTNDGKPCDEEPLQAAVYYLFKVQ